MLRSLPVSLIIFTACGSATDAHDPPTAAAAATSAPGADEMIGSLAPDWTAERWIHSPPLSLSALRGKVVFARWWTADCPYCAASAPVLRELDARYRKRGLVVIGFYHHKEVAPFDPAVYERTAREYRFEFPIAVDVDWKTLRRWWLDGHERDFTSASFLIDKAGKFRWVHEGGTLPQQGADSKRMQAAIETALAE